MGNPKLWATLGHPKPGKTEPSLPLHKSLERKIELNYELSMKKS